MFNCILRLVYALKYKPAYKSDLYNRLGVLSSKTA